MIVSVKVEGIINHHMKSANGVDYYILCGLDGGLAASGQEVVDTPLHVKIDCRECWNIFMVTTKYKKSDFEADLL